MTALTGEVAIVTGGGRGVGRAIADALARAGAAVATLSRSGGGAVDALALAVDVRDRREIEAAVETVEAELGHVGILVNNAGTGAAIGPSWIVGADEWWTDVEVSLRGAYLCSRAVLPGMLSRGTGRIVNISSSVAVRPSPYLSGYAAAKSAVLGFTESLAAETADRGIQVFAVTPGRVRTEMTQRMVESEEGRRFLPHLQSGRWLDGRHAAELVVALAAGEGDALSGRFLHALDDLAELVRHADEIRRRDLYVARLRTLSD